MDKFNEQVAEVVGAGRQRQGPKLLSPRAFLDLATDEVTRALRYDRPLSVVMGSVSGIKDLRQLGLAELAEQRYRGVVDHILAALRSLDRTGRLGRGEFGVLLPETALKNATETARRLHADTSGRSIDDAAGGPLTVSIGVAALSPRLRDPRTFLMSACFELRRAQSLGGDCVAAAPPETALVSIQRSAQIH